MSDDDEDRKDTQVLSRNDTPFDLEGTEEMDRTALLAAMQADHRTRNEEATARQLPAVSRDTEQLAAVGEKTVPLQAINVKQQVTQHYMVPDSLLNQARDPHFKTLDIPLEAILDPEATAPTAPFGTSIEFEAVVDAAGRITLPDVAVTGRFKRGTRVRVVVLPLEE